LAALVLASCQGVGSRQQILVSAAEQRMVLLDQGQIVGSYPVSTSKFGLGDQKNSYRTPIGKMVVARKIGDGKPKGAVFKSREWTGEVLPPDAPGRDPILTRILWLKGKESMNRNAFNRHIYIHGTTEERYIGRPVSYGCIRMKSDDVLDLYQRVRLGTVVSVLPGRMPMAVQTAEFKQGMRRAWNQGGQGLIARRTPRQPEHVVPQAEPIPLGGEGKRNPVARPQRPHETGEPIAGPDGIPSKPV